MGDVDEVEYRLGRIKADLLCELVAVCIIILLLVVVCG